MSALAFVNAILLVIIIAIILYIFLQYIDIKKDMNTMKSVIPKHPTVINVYDGIEVPEGPSPANFAPISTPTTFTDVKIENNWADDRWADDLWDTGSSPPPSSISTVPPPPQPRSSTPYVPPDLTMKKLWVLFQDVISLTYNDLTIKKIKALISSPEFAKVTNVQSYFTTNPELQPVIFLGLFFLSNEMMAYPKFENVMQLLATLDQQSLSKVESMVGPEQEQVVQSFISRNKTTLDAMLANRLSRI